MGALSLYSHSRFSSFKLNTLHPDMHNSHGYRPSYVGRSVVSWHDDVIKWKHFPRYWPFVRGIHRSSVNSPHKGQWCGTLMFSLIWAWINGWENNREAGDLIRHRAHYGVTVMICHKIFLPRCTFALPQESLLLQACCNALFVTAANVPWDNFKIETYHATLFSFICRLLLAFVIRFTDCGST